MAHLVVQRSLARRTAGVVVAVATLLSMILVQPVDGAPPPRPTQVTYEGSSCVLSPGVILLPQVSDDWRFEGQSIGGTTTITPISPDGLTQRVEAEGGVLIPTADPSGWWVGSLSGWIRRNDDNIVIDGRFTVAGVGQGTFGGLRYSGRGSIVNDIDLCPTGWTRTSSSRSTVTVRADPFVVYVPR